MDVPSVASLRDDFAAILEVVSAQEVTASDHSSILTLWGNFTRKIGQLIESKTAFEQGRRAALRKISLRDAENKLKRLIDIDQELDLIQEKDEEGSVDTQLLVTGLIDECKQYISVLEAISQSYLNRPVITGSTTPIAVNLPLKVTADCNKFEDMSKAARDVFGPPESTPPVVEEKKPRKRKIELPADPEPTEPEPVEPQNQSTFQKLMAKKA